MHWRKRDSYRCLRRTSVALMAALTLCQSTCLAQHNHNNIAVASPNFQKLTPIADKPKQADPAKPAHGPAAAKEPVKDEYPTVARMENITFGHANSGLNLNTRLDYLEATIFRRSFPSLTLYERAAKLQETLFGAVEDNHFPGYKPYVKSTTHPAPNTAVAPSPHEVQVEPSHHEEHGAVNTQRAAEHAQEQPGHAVEAQPFYQNPISLEELKIFVLQMINDRRQLQGLPTLTVDETANKVALAHADDMARRNVISHYNATGENPDQRYTKAGGSDAMMECLVMLNDQDKINRLTGMMFLRDLLKRQDDHDAIMSLDATSIGFAAAEDHRHNRVYACLEIINKHGIMQPIPQEIKAGEKIEVKGAMFEPYQIDRVTLAWENPNPEALASADESDEALPYFPPLDFVAYAGKSEHDWSTGVTVLKTAGILACIAGGMFIPPVALGVPAISMMGTGSNPEPKPASDIPIKGGMKVSGQFFNVKVGISNDSKPGLYYLTVWGLAPGAQKAVPISRRTILATTDRKHDVEKKQEEKKQEEKKEEDKSHE